MVDAAGNFLGHDTAARIEAIHGDLSADGDEFVFDCSKESACSGGRRQW
ncbi:NAD-dependent epimerase/dehydratase [Halorubrum californiense DSM 19288]|uniref:NAD-dependent epimerase/dehydratase n=1 Tax=Halorubrum californiense DSM 19288 TaxID=1227465 RepID=M0EJ16_9EURY|nr:MULTISPECIES: hypothetical protein [Halorubrum]ELZ47776.1 NAD-dependent epimerase/dehydratase [Halorubrum californiense DSM 19288]